MNRRDQNTGSRQAGGYRSDDDSWDATRQASQWQSDNTRQTGSGWSSGDEQRTSYGEDVSARSSPRSYDHPYASERRDDSRDHERYGSTRTSAQGTYPGYGERGHLDRGFGDRSSSGYRSSAQRDTQTYPARDFDASGGNDFSSFTSEDYGGRDFYRNRAGLTGGARSGESYRPSYGPGSWSSRDDYDGWREHGESRGFLERAGDEIASWFGSEDAQRRRAQDHRGRGPSDYTRSDERIREDVNDSLTHDWRVDASHVRVTVKDGEVTLEGTVDSRQSKRRAEDVADNVTGVRHVQNNLRVQSDTGVTAGTGTPGYSHSSASGTSSTSGLSSSGGSSVSGSATTAGTSGSSTTGNS